MRCLLILVLTLCGGPAALAAGPDAGFDGPRPVSIQGYAGDVMEPFLSRDGRWLFFNNRNDPKIDTDLFVAEAVGDGAFRFRGALTGANSRDLDAVASMDRAGIFYFVSSRDFAATGALIHRGHFADGRVSGVGIVPGLVSKAHPGFNFDAEVSADGAHLYYVESRWKTQTARLALAERRGDGFAKAAESEALLCNINGPGMVYAPATSADELELFFTRLPPPLLMLQPPPQIWMASRRSTDQPFGNPVRIEGLGDFVEAPTVSPDALTLYYHVCTPKTCRLYSVHRRRRAVGP